MQPRNDSIPPQVDPRPDAKGIVVLPITHEFENDQVDGFEGRVSRLLEQGMKTLVLDGRKIHGMGSLFPGCLLRTSRRLKERGGRLMIAYPNATIRALFEPADAKPILPLYETVEGALQEAWA